MTTSAPHVTAAAIKGSFLWPSMDARALNLEQDQLILDPSPEADSVLEYIATLESGRLTGSSLRELARLAEALRVSNTLEGVKERSIAGAADGLVSDLRRLELNGGVSLTVTAKSIARRLRRPLASIASPAGIDAAELVDSAAIVATAIGSIPAMQLLTAAVQHELGDERYALLEQLVRPEKKNGAAHPVSAGATARASSHGKA